MVNSIENQHAFNSSVPSQGFFETMGYSTEGVPVPGPGNEQKLHNS
jgi:hypothetical protein